MFTGLRYLTSQYIEEKHYARFGGLIVEKISNVDVKCVSYCSAKYRSRSPGQRTYRVSTLRRSTGAQNIGQGHWVKVPAESVHR